VLSVIIETKTNNQRDNHTANNDLKITFGFNQMDQSVQGIFKGLVKSFHFNKCRFKFQIYPIPIP